jgi:hypothetical protein
MSGPLPAPPSVSTSDGSKLVISGTQTVGAFLVADGNKTAHWARGWGSLPNALGGGSLNSWLAADKVPAGILDGAPLTSWVDQSASARNFNALAGGTLPVYRANGGPLALPCVDHTGAAGGLNAARGATLISMTQLTYFAVLMRVGSGTIQSIFNAANGAASAELGINGTGQVFLNRSATSGVGTSVAALALNQWSLVLVTLTVGGALHFDINGTVEDYAVGPQVFNDVPTVSYGSYQGTLLYAGKMAELGLYSTALSGLDLQALKDGLNHKWFG